MLKTTKTGFSLEWLCKRQHHLTMWTYKTFSQTIYLFFFQPFALFSCFYTFQGWLSAQLLNPEADQMYIHIFWRLNIKICVYIFLAPVTLPEVALENSRVCLQNFKDQLSVCGNFRVQTLPHTSFLKCLRGHTLDSQTWLSRTLTQPQRDVVPTTSASHSLR